MLCSGYLPKLNEMLRLQRKVTLQLHQILHLPRKMNLMIDPPHLWSVTYNARSNKSHPPTSPNLARLPRKMNVMIDPPHLSCVIYSEKSPCNFTKYCACQAKWISSLIRLTHETSFIMRGATKVTSQTHQYCACHAVMNRMSDPRNIWNVISNERSN